MKAVIIGSFGGPEALQIADLPVPHPGTGQVRIRVQAAAVNPVDVATRAGWLAEQGLMAATGQVGIGWDLRRHRRRRPGRRPVRGGRSRDRDRDLLVAPIGAQAEQIVLGTEAVAPAPRTWSAVEAATIPLNGLTAAQALDLLALRSGQWLLVTGAAGALGGYALQLAALRGLRTVAVAAPGDEELVRRLGADEFIPRTANLGSAVRQVLPHGADGALDAAVAGITALDAVRDGGSFVAVAAGAAPTPLRGIRVSNVSITPTPPGWPNSPPSPTPAASPASCRDPAAREVADAHRRLAKGGLRGRIVLQPAA